MSLSMSEKSSTTSTPVADALRHLAEMGITHQDISCMDDASYNAFAASLGWPPHIALTIRTRIRQMNPPQSPDVKDELANEKQRNAQLEAKLASMAAAAKVGEETKALAKKAKKAEQSTFQKVTALCTHTATHKDDIRSTFNTLNTTGTMEVCFVIDGTGSMSSYISAVKTNIKTIADEVKKATCADTKFGLVVYRDYEDANHIETFPFGSTTDLEQALGGVKATGGGDECEDCFGGLLEAANNMPWSTSARLIVWTGDAPQHGTRYNGSAGDNHATSAVTSVEIAKSIISRNILMAFIPITKKTDTMILVMQGEFEATGTSIVVTTGGDFITEILHLLKTTATYTCTMAGEAEAGDCGPDRLQINPRAGFGPEFKDVEVWVPQSCPVVEGVHPLEVMLVETPKCATEKTSAVTLATAPFAKGEMRYAFHCKLSSSSYYKRWSASKWVAKCPKRVESQMSIRQMRIQTVARFLAEEFSHRISTFPAPFNRKVDYAPVRLMKLDDKIWMLEPFLEGSYLKYNNNNGAVINELLAKNPIPQAFSHFTYEYSASHLLVADIQGVMIGNDYMFTDPAIHTIDRQTLKDTTNLGCRGMAAFFKTHVCNEVCSRLMLPKRSTSEDLVVSCVPMMP